MTSTAITVPTDHASRLLTGHSWRGRPRPPIEPFMVAAGGLRSTADDLLRLLAACLAPPAGPVGAALALAQRPHLRTSRRSATGLCWMVATPRRRPRLVWHNGGTWGFRAFAGFAPGHGTAAVVLSDTFRGVERLGFALAAPAGGRRR